MFDKRPQILVEIYGKTGLEQRKKCPIEGNEIEIEPKKTRNPGWYAKFSQDSIIDYQVRLFRFKLLRQKVMVKRGATECINLNLDKPKDPASVPIWDSRMEKEVADAHILKHAGTSMQKIQIPMWLIIIILLSLGFNVLTFLISSGRVRFG